MQKNNKKTTIDESVNDMLSSMTITKKQFEDYKEDMRRLIAINKKLNFERLGQIEKQINKLENRLGALYDDKLDGLRKIYTYVSVIYGKVK